ASTLRLSLASANDLRNQSSRLSTATTCAMVDLPPYHCLALILTQGGADASRGGGEEVRSVSPSPTQLTYRALTVERGAGGAARIGVRRALMWTGSRK